MTPILLKNDVYWIGAVDFNLRNFHHYSRSPLGTTYNAYLIKDEKNVLVDTVSKEYTHELFTKLENLIDPQKIDYIICNHLERDHSGCLEKMVEVCKPEKIFCSVTGEKYLRAQFNADSWNIQTVKDGETINIGKRNITFFDTKMLHWPDSMVSYINEDKILFCNDIFGQNIGTSYRFIDEHPSYCTLQSIKDYYNNIVLPYSPLVIKLLDRIEKAGLEFDMLAPDHGLIFRTKEDINFIINTYKELANQPYKLKAVIVYESLWEATAKMANAVGDGLSSLGVPYTIIDLQENHCSSVMNALADASAIILGSSTRNNMPLTNMIGTMAHIKGLRPKNLVGATFGSYGWSGEAPKIMEDELKAMGVEIVSESAKAFFGPNKDELKSCFELGVNVAKALKEKVQA